MSRCRICSGVGIHSTSCLLKGKPAVQVPLRCEYCGETWLGSVGMVGKKCSSNPVDEPAVVLDDEYDDDPTAGFVIPQDR